MNQVNVLFFGRQYRERKVKINDLDRQSSQIHEGNMAAIANARETADTLKQVLTANGITIKIAKATGHKHRGTRNTQSDIQHSY